MNLLDTVVHPVADMWPLIEGDAFDALVDNIQRNGQLVPIIYHEGRLIDGRNRYRACRKLGIDPKSVEWNQPPGMHVADFIISVNGERRHLTLDQINVSVAKSLNWKAEDLKAKKAATQLKGKTPDGKPVRADGSSVNTESCSPTKRDAKEMHANSLVGQVAAAANTSHHKAAQAVAVVKAAEKSPEAAAVLADVEAGKITLNQGVRSVREPKPKKQKSIDDYINAARKAISKAWNETPASEKRKTAQALYRIIDELT